MRLKIDSFSLYHRFVLAGPGLYFPLFFVPKFDDAKPFLVAVAPPFLKQ
jgi:hypothetical protein